MKKLTFVPILLVVIVLALGIYSYKKSNDLKEQGDRLVNSQRLTEALIYYQEADSTFPFRNDLREIITGTKLLINSQREYGQIVDLDYAEVQELPPLESIQPPKLVEGDLFVPILMYHHIRINPMPGNALLASLNVSPDLLNSELNYLSTHNYHVISLTELSKALNGGFNLPVNPIVLSFDDGYKNFYENAYPLLNKYNMKAIEFVITQVESAPAYLSWDQIIEMDKSGLIEIGAHTQHHPSLSSLSLATINKEIIGSKTDIETHLGKKTNWFAYPYGDYNNYIIATVEKAGFIGAVSTNYSAVQNKNKLFVLPRIMADGRFTLDEFAHRLQK